MSKMVLIVDDSRMMRLMVRTNLEAAGFEVVEAEDGDDGIEKAANENPDLIILDAVMPRLGGFDALKVLKSDSKTAAIPVIMLTAQSNTTDQIEGWSGGASEYVTKPFNPATLMEIVQKVLGEEEYNLQKKERQIEKLTVLQKLKERTGANGRSEGDGGDR
ncbi:MAG: response regulator [Actinobacteria bacterium]|nr:response regulator [Actinomycetota bacterium]